MEGHITEKRPDILICECHSTEHQMVIHYSDDNGIPMCYLHVHLNKRPLLQRIVYGIKYIFGHQSRFGAFDEFIINPEDSTKIKEISDYLKKQKGEQV